MSIYFFEIAFIAIFFLVDTIMFVKIKNLSFKNSVLIFLFWIAVALIFFAILHFQFNPIKAQEFLAGYTLERTLSIDNIFVFYIIFKAWRLGDVAKERILFWGIIMALILRLVFIIVGAAIIKEFYWVMYIFASFLIFTGIKLLFQKEEGEDSANFENNLIVKFSKKLLPISSNFEGEKFTTRINGKFFFTPLFLVLILIAFSDIIFALDSIPAIFGITLDPFIIITANFLSLMGLRAIFHLITHVIEFCHYIKYALAAILVFIGIKMCIASFYHVPISYSLGFIFISIALAIAFSILQKNAR